MAQADVLSLVSRLATVQSDATAVASYYTRIVQEHGLQRESLTDAAFVAVTAGTLTYTLPTAALRGLAFAYDDTQLVKEDKRGIEGTDELWRVRVGEPRTILFEDERRRQFDLVPVPRRTGATIGITTPFSGAFPADNATVIYTDNATDVQPWEELAQACEILAREFGRDSDHADAQSSTAWRQLANFFFTIVDTAHARPH